MPNRTPGTHADVIAAIDAVDRSTSARGRLDRLGEGMLPQRDSVIQEGDVLHVVIREENATHAYHTIEHGPEEE